MTASRTYIIFAYTRWSVNGFSERFELIGTIHHVVMQSKLNVQIVSLLYKDWHHLPNGAYS